MTAVKSTTREQELFLNPGINDIVFHDTKPNHIHLNNLSAANIFLAVNGIASASVYDKKVVPNGEGLFSRDTGFTRASIFVDGVSSSRIRVTSFEADFNPATLAGGTDTTGISGATVTTDGIVKGFQVALPAGANNIGKVVVTEMPAITTTQQPLVAGSAIIGKVDVNSLPPLPAGVNKIGDVGVIGGLTISSMPPVQVSSEPVKQSHENFDGSIGTTLVTYDMGTRSINQITYLSNDDLTNDLYVGFDSTVVTAATTNGLDGVIRMLPGETLTDMGRKCSKIHFIRLAGTGNARFVGV